MASLVRLRARVGAEGDLVCELQEGLVVDVEAAGAAPGDEGVGLDVRLDSHDPALLEALLRRLGACPPIRGESGEQPEGADALLACCKKLADLRREVADVRARMNRVADLLDAQFRAVLVRTSGETRPDPGGSESEL